MMQQEERGHIPWHQTEQPRPDGVPPASPALQPGHRSCQRPPRARGAPPSLTSPPAQPGHPAGPPFPVSHSGVCGAALPPHTLIINLQRWLPAREAAPSCGRALPAPRPTPALAPSRERAGSRSPRGMRTPAQGKPPGGAGVPRAASPGDGAGTGHLCRQRFPPRRFPLERPPSPPAIGAPQKPCAPGRKAPFPLSREKPRGQPAAEGRKRRCCGRIAMATGGGGGHAAGPPQHLETCREPMGK